MECDRMCSTGILKMSMMWLQGFNRGVTSLIPEEKVTVARIT